MEEEDIRGLELIQDIYRLANGARHQGELIEPSRLLSMITEFRQKIGDPVNQAAEAPREIVLMEIDTAVTQLNIRGEVLHVRTPGVAEFLDLRMVDGCRLIATVRVRMGTPERYYDILAIPLSKSIITLQERDRYICTLGGFHFLARAET